MASEKQIRANQQNALKSTGPKDTSKTSKNAMKHGLTSTKLIEEHQKDAREMYDDLVKNLNLTSHVELLIGIRMAHALWKLKCINTNQMVRQGNAWANKFNDKLFLNTVVEEKPYEIETEINPNITEHDELIGRYETATENSFYKALNMLVRVKKEKLASLFEND